MKKKSIADSDPEEWMATACKLARDLLEIAELAMPTTYFNSDSRCKFARNALKKMKQYE